MIKITLGIDGMACGMCEAYINEAVRNAFPVKKVTSSHTKKETVILAEREILEPELRKVIAEAIGVSRPTVCVSLKSLSAPKAIRH